MKNSLFFCGLFGILFLSSFALALHPYLYDNFESGSLDTTKWEVRPDVEGQPLMDEYGVVSEDGNFVFHTRQNNSQDRRVYLFPTRSFRAGDSIEYDLNLLSREGTYASMILVTGDQYYRLGIRGTAAGFDELGVAHVKLVFAKDHLHLERTTPSGNLLIDDLPLDDPNGVYQLYIGSFTGSNGKVHMDYDNFWINGRLQTDKLG